MIRGLTASALIAIAMTSGAAPASAQPNVRTVVDGLDFPAGIAFDDAGTMYVTERSGRIRRVVDGELDPQPVATLRTTTAGEAGLLGIAVAPDATALYVFATAFDGASNEVWRVPLDGGKPEIVVAGLPAGVYHNGGGVAFAPDGMLLVSNGESHEDARAQDPDALGGKVYRYTPDGRVPQDNPFGDSPTYALGLRNPFGLAVDPVSGEAFVTENGPKSHDEVDRVVAGGNYGWPVTSGPAGEVDTSGLAGTYHDPLLDFPDTIVPTGIAFAGANATPDVRGSLFFASFQEQVIRRVELNEARTEAVRTEVLLASETPLIALAWGPHGLYFSTPDAVKVIPLAAEPSPGRRPSPDETVAAPEADEPPSSVPGIALVVGAVAVTVAALAYAFSPRGRR